MGYVSILEEKEQGRKNRRETALTEAQRLSALLRREFEYAALYLIGSVLTGRGFRCQSDIDFVIKGLKKDLFLKALALLMKNSSFAIDLKPWEDLTPDSRSKVEREGRTLR